MSNFDEGRARIPKHVSAPMDEFHSQNFLRAPPALAPSILIQSHIANQVVLFVKNVKINLPTLYRLR